MADSARRSTAAQFFAEEEESENTKVSVYDKVFNAYYIIF